MPEFDLILQTPNGEINLGPFWENIWPIVGARFDIRLHYDESIIRNNLPLLCQPSNYYYTITACDHETKTVKAKLTVMVQKNKALPKDP